MIDGASRCDPVSAAWGGEGRGRVETVKKASQPSEEWFLQLSTTDRDFMGRKIPSSFLLLFLFPFFVVLVVLLRQYLHSVFSFNPGARRSSIFVFSREPDASVISVSPLNVSPF